MQIDKKNKKIKERLSETFKQHCKQQLNKQPSIFLVNCVKDKAIVLDMDIFIQDDLIFIPIMFRLPITKVHLMCQQHKKAEGPNSSPIYTTSKFKDLLKELSNTISSSLSLRSVIFERVPLSIRHMMALKQSISATQSLKQLSFRQCQIGDDHLQAIKSAIAKNQSLVIFDLSFNKLCNVGGMIGKIMSQHSARRDQLIWFASLRSQVLEDDLSKKGICEVNLEGNELNDRSASQLVQFLNNDQWSRCLNLKNNKLGVEGVKQFARLMKKNSALISLDLRGNPGLTKQYSVYILKKLKQNIQKYRQQKKKYSNNKQVTGQVYDNKNNNQHKSLEQSRKQSVHKKTQGTILQFTINKNNVSSVHKSGKSKFESNGDEQCCDKCRRKTLDMLKLEKNNLDLQIEIKKLKHIMLTKNIDISAILPHQHNATVHNPSQANESFNRAVQLSMNMPESDEDLILRVEQIMMELTKIMDNIDAQQITQINISNNNISNANSLSNTIPIFAHPSELEELEESSIQEKEGEKTIMKPTSSVQIS